MAYDGDPSGGGSGGGGEPHFKPRYVLRHYGPLNLGELFAKAVSRQDVSMGDIHSFLGGERVDAFNPRDHQLPDNCAHTLVNDTYMGSGDDHTGLIGMYSYGHLIDRNAFLHLAAKRVAVPRPVLAEKAPQGFFVLTATRGLSCLYDSTIAVLETAVETRPIHWRNPDLIREYPSLRHL